MDEIKVISADKDGADLRRDIVRNLYYTRCCGTHDEREINDAINSLGKVQWALRAEDWLRVFGGK